MVLSFGLTTETHGRAAGRPAWARGGEDADAGGGGSTAVLTAFNLSRRAAVTEP
jgi:hypothetical protein